MLMLYQRSIFTKLCSEVLKIIKKRMPRHFQKNLLPVLKPFPVYINLSN